MTWLREQTELGQGISEAIAMLKSRLSGAARHNAASPRQVPATAHSPLDALLKNLREGDTEAAQSSWDELAIALSPAAITNALLKLYLALQQTAPADSTFATERAHAFLLRKATVLLDHAGPDSGMRTFALIVASDLHAIPATLLASAVARCGHRVVTPFPVAATLTAVDAMHATTPNSIVLIGTSDEQTTSFSRLLPGAEIHRWNPDEKERDANSLAAILHTLQNP